MLKLNKELIKGSTITLILNELSKEPMYGYKMIKEGTLYPILHDLEKKKFIESYWEVENGRRRKYYKITKKGVKELEVREQEWQLFSKTMGVVLRG